MYFSLSCYGYFRMELFSHSSWVCIIGPNSMLVLQMMTILLVSESSDTIGLTAHGGQENGQQLV